MWDKILIVFFDLSVLALCGITVSRILQPLHAINAWWQGRAVMTHADLLEKLWRLFFYTYITVMFVYSYLLKWR